MECLGKMVCLLGLFIPHTSLAKILLWAMPAEHLYPENDQNILLSTKILIIPTYTWVE